MIVGRLIDDINLRAKFPRKELTRLVLSDIGIDMVSLEDFKASISTWQEEIAEKWGIKAEPYFELEYYGEYSEINLKVKSLETKEEWEERIRDQVSYEDRQKSRRYQNYLELKEEFENVSS